jgi:glycosyltransferase involved in cell wall biosynthesis
MKSVKEITRDPSGVRVHPARVAIVTHYMPPHIGGIELVAESLFGAYKSLGFEVRWIASRAPRDAASVEGSRIRVACWNWLENNMGVPWPVWGPQGFRQLSRLVEWADVIHVHDCLYLGSALAVLLARRKNKKTLLSQHIGFISYRSSLLNIIERFAYKTVGRSVAGSASRLVYSTRAAEEFMEGLLKGRPVYSQAIPNGIDTDRFRPPAPEERASSRKELGLGDSERVVLFVGRLVEKKGVDIFLRVCRLMPSVKFLLVGDGPLAEDISRSRENLVWRPSVPPESMDKVYKSADMLLLPSHGEGLPLSVQEAMSCGLPVVVSRGESFARALEREAACICVERDAPAIKETLTRLFDDLELREGTSARARGLALREWSLAAMARRYCDAVRALAEEAGLPAAQAEDAEKEAR